MSANQVYGNSAESTSRTTDAKTTIKPFARQGHFTALDNAVIDCLMPELSGAELKVLLLVIRRTRGWQKEEDALSYRQITEGTGIRSSSTVSRAVTKLEKMGCLTVGEGQSTAGHWTPSIYALNASFTTSAPNAHKPTSISGPAPASIIEAEPTSISGLGPTSIIEAEPTSISGLGPTSIVEDTKDSTTEQFGISDDNAESRGQSESVVEERVGRNTSHTERKSGFKISGIDGEAAAGRVTAFRQNDPLGESVYRLIQEAASRNKSGEMAATRAYNSFIAEVLYHRERGVTDEHWRYGIQEALRRGKTSGINYARSVAVNRLEEEPKKGSPARREVGREPPGTSAPEESAMPEESPGATERKHELAEAATEACGYNPRGLFRACRAVEEWDMLTLVHADPDEAAFIAEEFQDVLSWHSARVTGLKKYREERP